MLARTFARRANSAAARALCTTRAPNVHNLAGASLWLHEPPSAAQQKALVREQRASSIIDTTPQSRASETPRQVDQAFAEHHQREQLERILEFHGVFKHGPKRSLVESLLAWRATL